jgi:hypothetical protein
MVAKKLRNVLWMLIGDQPKADFRHCSGRDNTFDTSACVPADDTVDANVWPDCCEFVKAITRFSPASIDVRGTQDFLVRRAGSSHVVTFFLAPRAYFLIKAGDGDAALIVVQSSDDIAEC